MSPVLHAVRRRKSGAAGFLLVWVTAAVLPGGFVFALGDLMSGRTLYGANCAVCHGESGKGNGPRAMTLQPRPVDLTDPQIMGAVTPVKIERSVVQGLPNVEGHAFGHLLTPDEVRDIVHYVNSLSKR